jgi:hypothetical protein
VAALFSEHDLFQFRNEKVTSELDGSHRIDREKLTPHDQINELFARDIQDTKRTISPCRSVATISTIKQSARF